MGIRVGGEPPEPPAEELDSIEELTAERNYLQARIDALQAVARQQAQGTRDVLAHIQLVARRGADGVIGLEIDENMVDGFVAGSPAATDGIFYEGDRIASVDGKLVEAGRQMIEFMKPGLPKYTFGVV